MMTLVARFRVDGWDPRAVDGFDGDWVGVARMSKEFTQGLVGSSVVMFLASGEEGSRSYLAAERITGSTDDGRAGSITVHHGAVEGKPESGFGLVVPRTGTDAFADWSGSARIEHDDDGAFFVFDLA
jgi:Protein of unknown function (DUF3224)